MILIGNTRATEKEPARHCGGLPVERIVPLRPERSLFHETIYSSRFRRAHREHGARPCPGFTGYDHTPDNALPAVNQTLSGLWLSELRRPGPTGLQPPIIPTIITFFADGTSLGSPADGTQTPTHAIRIRVGDRKFLGTGYFFNFNESRVLTTITKLCINYQMGRMERH